MKYYNFPAENNRKCDVKLFASNKIYENIEKTAIKQLLNASTLPGLAGVVGMPDLHQGYGLPIGGIMAADYKQGIISPGAVGFDINCGVRLLKSELNISDLNTNKDNLNKIMQKIAAEIPAGVGSSHSQSYHINLFKKIRFSSKTVGEILKI